MKLIVFILLSFSVFSQDFDKCAYEVNPSICVGKKLSEKIEDLSDIKNHKVNLKAGIYNYLKGHDQVHTGLRKIEVKRNIAKQLEVTYYGASGAILTYFTCYNDSSRICHSPNRHLMIITDTESFFIDWSDDTNGTYQLKK